MNSIKTYLVVVGVLLGIALLAGVVVWYLYQNLDGAQPSALPFETGEQGGTTLEQASTTAASETSMGEEPFVLTADALSPSQRAVLATFGLEDAEVTITEAHITCAKDAVGTTRFEEIMNGAAPTPLEALALLPCFKK